MINISPVSSKSIAHRAIICACLSEKDSTITNITFSEDILATIHSLNAIGADIKIFENYIKVYKSNFQFGTLDCNESGSTLRFLLPLVAVLGYGGVFIGKESLLSRPNDSIMKLLIDNNISYTNSQESIKISGTLLSDKYYISGDLSSQYLSGLLLALPFLNKQCEIILTTPLSSKPYIDITLNVLSKFGIKIQNDNYTKFTVLENCKYSCNSFEVEADYSAAAFFLTASKIYTPLNILGLNKSSYQGDREIVEILKNDKPFIIDVSNIPDLVPIIAVYMCFLKGESKIQGANRLIYKESNRLVTTVSELKNLGADITNTTDSITVIGKGYLNGGKCKSHNDHRIAMAVAIASLICKNDVYLDNKDCVNKSYPSFWEDFKLLGKEIKNYE